MEIAHEFKIATLKRAVVVLVAFATLGFASAAAALRGKTEIFLAASRRRARLSMGEWFMPVGGARVG